MTQKIHHSNDKKYLFLSFFLPFIGYTLVMLFSQYAPFGSNAILYSDMYHQYYPFFVEFRDTLRSGGSLLYNWDMGMGLDYLGLISYYLASPLNLLSILVPESMLLGFFSMLVPVKLGLAGLFFSIFLKNIFNRMDHSVSVFACGYALCAWALGYQWNIMWLDTFALLPLVVLGLIRLLRERKFILYTVSLFFSIVCNYYIGFFVCIFVALCFLIYQICYCRKVGRFFSDLGVVFLFSLLAIGMTAFLELPTLVSLGNTYSSVNKFPTTFDLNITKNDTLSGLLDAMRQVAGNTAGGLEITFKEGLPNLYCGLFPLALAIQYLLNGKFKLRERLCSLFLLIFFMLSFIIRQLDYIWHGFHFTNMIPYRFSFLFSFVVLVMAYRAYLELERCPKWRAIVSCVIALGLCACSDSRTDPVFIVYNLVFLGIYFAMFLSMERPKMERSENQDGPAVSLVPLSKAQKQKNRYIAALLCFAMAVELVCALVNFGARFGGPGVSNYPKGTEDAALTIAYMQEREAGTVYYRAETDHTQTLNDDALNGYSGITLFSSSTNVRVTKFMSALGFGAKPSYNRYAYEEGSPVSNLFLALKYLICRDSSYLPSETYTHIYNMGSVHLQENNAYLPLGFMVMDGALSVSSEDSDAGSFAYQNRIFSAVTGLSDDVYTELLSYEATGDDGITVTPRAAAGSYSYSTGADSGTVTISFVVPSDGLVCLDFYVNKRNSVTVYKNGSKLYKESLNLDQMLSVGDCAAGDLIEAVFDCKSSESGRITLNAALLNSDCFWQGYHILDRSTLELTELSGTTATGTVQVAEDATILYTSIPYDQNWTATVDGAAAEIFPVFDTMVAIRLTPGVHTVTFHYHNTAFYQGLLISWVCLSVFLLISAAVILPKRKGKFEERKKHI